MSDRAKKAASELNLWVPDGNLEEAERKAEAIIRKHFPSDDLLKAAKGSLEEEIDVWKEMFERQGERVEKLEDALNRAIGWISYAEECDPFYFSEEQAPTFKESMEFIRSATKLVTAAGKEGGQ